MIRRFSTFWAELELKCAALLAAGITLLILLNVITRTIGIALFWVDELAIYLMIWMTFFAASAAIHHKNSVAVTLLADALDYKQRRLLMRCVDVILFAMALGMIYFCWRWFLPLDLLQTGLDIEAFQGETFNFIYSEITNTLPIRKVWVWLIMWFFAFGLFLHSLNNLLHPTDQHADQSGTS